jgi:hypothetical protein
MFVGANDAGPDPYPPDKKGLDTLTQVTRLLLQDRERMCARAGDVLVDALHVAVTTVYSKVQTSDEAEDHVEDLVGEGVKEVGFALGRPQLKRFDVDRSYIRKHKGPAQAAAGAIVDAMEGQRKETSHGRSVFDAKARRANQPPIAGPLNRYVSLGTVARFLAHVLEEADAEAEPDILLPIETLRSGASEALLDRVGAKFKERFRDDLQRHYDSMTECCLALLRGENPVPHWPATPETEQARDALRVLGAELLISSLDGEAALVQTAREAVRRLLDNLKNALDIA